MQGREERRKGRWRKRMVEGKSRKSRKLNDK
jgi:hypothetical protein